MRIYENLEKVKKDFEKEKLPTSQYQIHKQHYLQIAFDCLNKKKFLSTQMLI